MTCPEPRTKAAWQSKLVTVGLLALSGAAGCGGADEDHEPEVVSPPTVAVRGLPDAIGAVGPVADVNRLGDGFSPWCTGVLIGPQTVVTSADCIPSLEWPSGFGIGENGRAPRRILAVVDGELAPARLTPRIFDDSRRPTLAAVYLKDPVLDVMPLALGTLTPERVGARFRGAGYQYEPHQGTDVADVVRESRSVVLRSLAGPYYPVIFAGNFRAFRKWWWGSLDPLDYPGLDPAIRAYYQGAGPAPLATSSFAILDGGYEVLAEESSSQRASLGLLSFSDLLIKRDASGAYRVYGVASSPPPDTPDYNYVIYETFGPETRAFLERAISWKDPCASRRQTGGFCDGATARWCGSDHKTQSSQNCAAFSRTCVTAAGQPVCQ
jgi:hypothetical protein